ncbi:MULTISPECIES: type II toxin-antitoxin system RelE family toxin [Pantoea]|uniref:type II toxin-antitoxin system RelE family toxin n=1 Tax=Pantoea TaxID=53335 RepID=UPI0012B98951|nr:MULTISPECIES: type II toxin-antitoxin system RelE/ParE family toxin [Pantoea]KAF6667692.1 type II toxin-antitoxin system RelE/ParE family toxin [Pantoea sp. EKM101V]
MVEVVWSRRALKHLMKIDTRFQKIIHQKVGELVSFPIVSLDIRKLQGSDNHFRLRVGNYRIIFAITGGEPVILEIKEVARRTSVTY